MRRRGPGDGTGRSQLPRRRCGRGVRAVRHQRQRSHRDRSDHRRGDRGLQHQPRRRLQPAHDRGRAASEQFHDQHLRRPRRAAGGADEYGRLGCFGVVRRIRRNPDGRQLHPPVAFPPRFAGQCRQRCSDLPGPLERLRSDRHLRSGRGNFRRGGGLVDRIRHHSGQDQAGPGSRAIVGRLRLCAAVGHPADRLRGRNRVPQI